MGLEQFQTLFFFVKVLAVLPHVITLNERTLRFNQFSCGWRSPATWWFVLIFGGHIMWIFITSGDAFKNISHSNDSTMIIIVRMIWHISYTLVKFIPVLLLFYVWRLKSVFKVFRKVDHALKHASVHVKTCTTKERTIFGIIIGVLINIGVNVFGSVYFPLLLKSVGFINMIAGLTIEVIIKFQMATWCTLFHLLYYNIAYRISTLKLLINNPTKTGYLLDQLAKASYHLRCTFSMSALLIIFISFFDFTLCMFFAIHSFSQATPIGNNFFLQIILVLGNLILAVTVIFSAQMPASEVKRLREHVLELSTQLVDLQDSTECSALLMGLSPDRFELRAAGLFTVKKELIPAITGAVITYLAVLLQNTFYKMK